MSVAGIGFQHRASAGEGVEDPAREDSSMTACASMDASGSALMQPAGAAVAHRLALGTFHGRQGVTGSLLTGGGIAARGASM